MYVGDYWTITINNTAVKCRIAGFDLYLYTGDTKLTKHHIVLLPDVNLAVRAMNSSATTSGGYKGSEFFTGSASNTGSRAWCASKLNTAFGSKLLSHREVVTNAINASAPVPGGYLENETGCSSNWEWVDSTVELLNEVEVYGSRIWGGAFDIGIGHSQFPLFALAPDYIHGDISNTWWLRSIASSTRFADVYHNGIADYGAFYANAVNSIRPKWLIG